MPYPIDQVSVRDTITFTSEHQQNGVFNGVSAEVIEKEKNSNGHYYLVVEVTENNGERIRKEIKPEQVLDNLTRTFAENRNRDA